MLKELNSKDPYIHYPDSTINIVLSFSYYLSVHLSIPLCIHQLILFFDV